MSGSPKISENGSCRFQKSDFPIQMYDVHNIYHGRYKSFVQPEPSSFNAVQVVSYYVTKGQRQFDWNSARIRHYPISNFFRFLFGKKLKNPHKIGWFVRPSLKVNFADGRRREFPFESDAIAAREYKKFDVFMRNTSI